MKISYKVIGNGDGQIREVQFFEEICCDEMRKALLHGETTFANRDAKELWLYCPFCQKEILY